MSLLIFNAKLLDLTTSVSDKGELKMRLVFKSKKFDKGLEEWVPCSQNVTVIEDHHHMKDFYLSFKGREIYLPIDQSTQMNGMAIFYKTTGDGKPLMLKEEKQPELKTA
ncbi:hypothetical protein [Acinetobacter gyllenbergii]|uniref:hypothetical protein n=1 Tax=Acinetobacter gyllenbergii TaxID=134534 RepID=UPI0003BE9190|nr:hypothetical protein [Acinetobacter gyllenbergii]ESK55680.1 hypothetical protein F987_00511 [Acinetobacter gyllenbergii NIPH 230]